jgi:aldose 1-epimerase
MTRRTLLAAQTIAVVAIAASASAQPYSSERGGDVVRLRDAKTETVVSILPTVGNIAFSMTIKGQEILHWPYASIDDFKARPALSGIPLLAPWANRLDEQAFYANGTRYAFDMALGNVRGAIPIHGFLSTTGDWRLVEARADGAAAWVTSVLDVSRRPSWMKQWPFAHTIEMVYRLHEGALEVRTTIANASAEPMPVAIGFHPYFRLTDSPHEEWTIAVAARTHWLLAPNKVPTGATEPAERVFADRRRAPLGGRDLDDVFGDLERDTDGRATMAVGGRRQRIEVVLGARYRSVVVWSPSTAAFVCIEPMVGVTDAINLAQRGLYGELQSVPPGGRWSESFWVKPSGF